MRYQRPPPSVRLGGFVLSTTSAGELMDEQVTHEYRAAFDAWLAQLERVHAVLLDGEPMDPMHRIALLRRESHLKERYEEARARLLGLPLETGAESPFPGEA
ncbi:MAG: hypothetical protein ACRD3V_26850 [Vicinamibacteria bacterium]